ncbi:MAG: ribulose-phosphate 3-epimerase [Actinomycetota bacterium]
MSKVKLAPSLLNADFSDLREAVSSIEDTADVIHLDVMDGNFVPNITFGPLVVKAVRAITDLPLDVHLMIAHPAEYVEDFVRAGADWVSFHAEVTRHPGEILGLIHSLSCRAGVVINPQTPAERLYEYLELMEFALVMTVMPGFGGQAMIPEALYKVEELKSEAGRRGLGLEVEVDGGVKTENLHAVLEAGTDIVVVGSSIFGAPDPRMAAREIRSILDGS